MKEMPYREGSVFAIPLRSGGYGVGLVARMAPEGKIILVYLFGPKRLVIPNEDELYKINRNDVIRRVRCGDLALINGSWLILGQLKEWMPSNWPMPKFIHKDSLSNRLIVRTYSDSDPSKLVQQDFVSTAAIDLEPDGLHGYGAVELLVNKQLNPT